jgi:hypothetical protein
LEPDAEREAEAADARPPAFSAPPVSTATANALSLGGAVFESAAKPARNKKAARKSADAAVAAAAAAAAAAVAASASASLTPSSPAAGAADAPATSEAAALAQFDAATEAAAPWRKIEHPATDGAEAFSYWANAATVETVMYVPEAVLAVEAASLTLAQLAARSAAAGWTAVVPEPAEAGKALDPAAAAGTPAAAAATAAPAESAANAASAATAATAAAPAATAETTAPAASSAATAATAAPAAAPAAPATPSAAPAVPAARPHWVSPSGVTTLVKPAELRLADALDFAVATCAVRAEAADYEFHVDPDGAEYVHNERTGETQRHRPACIVRLERLDAAEDARLVREEAADWVVSTGAGAGAGVGAGAGAGADAGAGTGAAPATTTIYNCAQSDNAVLSIALDRDSRKERAGDAGKGRALG